MFIFHRDIKSFFFVNVKMYTGKYTEEFASLFVFKFAFQQFKNDCLQKHLLCVYTKANRRKKVIRFLKKKLCSHNEFSKKMCIFREHFRIEFLFADTQCNQKYSNIFRSK